MSVVANVAINVDSRGAVSKLRQVQTQAQATERAFGALSSALGALGVGFALTKVIADVKELDTNLRRLATVGGDVKALDAGLGTLSKNLGGVANKAELAAASYEALSAGFSETGANLRLVEAATKAAVGGLVSVTSAVDVTTSVLNAYNMSGNDAVKVTDSISKAIEVGKLKWNDYTSQLGKVASIASVAGVSLDEVNAFVATATVKGATAEQAFTGLSAVLSGIITPTKESSDAAEALGIQWNLGGLQAKGFGGLIKELSAAIEKDRTLAAKLVGGQEALRAAFAAASNDGKLYADNLNRIGDAAGKTDMDFQEMKGSLENTLKALDTAFANLSEALGKAFGPTVVLVIRDVTGSINGFADAMNAVPQPVLRVTGELVKIIVQLLLVQKAMQGIIALRAAFIATMAGMATTTATAGTAATASAGAFALYTNNTKTLTAAAAASAAPLSRMNQLLTSLASIGLITIVVNVVTNGLANLMAANAELNKLRGRKEAGGAAAMFKGSTKEEVTRQQGIARNVIKQEKAQVAELNKPLSRIAQFLNVGNALEGFIGVPDASQRKMLAQGRTASAQAVLGLDPSQFPSAAPAVQTTSTVPTGGGTTGDGKGGKTDAERAAEAAAKLEQQTQERLRSLSRETELIAQITNLKELQAAAELAGDKELQSRLATEEQIVNIIQRTAQDLEGVTDQRLEQSILGKAQAEITQVQVGAALELNRIEAERTKTITDIVAGFERELVKIQATTEAQKQAIQFLEIENQLKEQGVILSAEDADVIRGKIALIGQVAKEQEYANNRAQELTDIYEGMSGAFANAFGGAIDAAISGTESLGSALGNLAKELLATIGKMLIIYGIAQALGAAGGDDGVGVFSFLAKAFGFKEAKDGAYWPGGFEAFADGGVVNKPTMGLIGEGGESEYVIPASKMSAAMKRYGSGARGSSVIPANGDTSEGGGGMAAAGTGAIDVRYTVERINSVDYVTADQFQQGMKQAATQGAKQGEQSVLRKMQQSPSVRRRVGMS